MQIPFKIAIKREGENWVAEEKESGMKSFAVDLEECIEKMENQLLETFRRDFAPNKRVECGVAETKVSCVITVRAYDDHSLGDFGTGTDETFVGDDDLAALPPGQQALPFTCPGLPDDVPCLIMNDDRTCGLTEDMDRPVGCPVQVLELEQEKAAGE